MTTTPSRPRPSIRQELAQLRPEELEALDQQAVERLTGRAQQALAQAKAERSRITAHPAPDRARLSRANEKVALLGSTVAALCQRRSALRQAARRQLGGSLPTLEAAIARACASVLPEREYRRVIKVAQGIIQRAQRDAAKGPRA